MINPNQFQANEAWIAFKLNDALHSSESACEFLEEPQYFSLLTKVQKAIRTFPDCKITVEGHTDSYGGDEMNQKLSEEQAKAVRQYLIANMGLSETKISAVGFGESKPIANNETAEGRAKNRRIDLVIHPQLPGTY